MRKDLILALGYLEAGLFAPAAEVAAEALVDAPDDPDANYLRGIALDRQGQTVAALPHLEAAARRLIYDASAQHALGSALARLDRHALAHPYLDRAYFLDPTVKHAGTLAETLVELMRADEAEVLMRRVVAESPDDAVGWANLGAALVDIGRDAEAIAACDRALELSPNDVEAHMTRAFANLLGGNWSAAWPDYEWRWRRKAFRDAYAAPDCPRWRGERLPQGARLWVRCEQGLGDGIQFVRFVRLAAEAAGVPVALSAPRELCRLFAGVAGIDACAASAKRPPDCVAEIPLLSLPGIFGTTPESVPGPFPYLVAPAAPRLPESGGRPRIGVVWGDKPKARSRGIDAPSLAAALFGLDLAVFSLQVGPRAAEIPEGSGWIDLAPEIHDFADTAALMAQMDAVISVDTAALHVAGALGVPVYILLMRHGDWRWLRERSETPWYPSARLLRQEIQGDWSAPLGRLRAALAARDFAT